MHHTVHIKPSGYNFNVKAGETVLDAALRQGYQFPHDCMSGTCGACHGYLLEGQVEYDESFLPALSEEEREAGHALFCSAKPVSDLVIYVDNVIGPESLPVKKLIYTVKSFEQLSDSIYRVFLLPPASDRLNYHAGQYVEILQRDSSPRPFSIANAPTETGIIELHIRYSPDNPYTAELLNEIQTAGQLTLRGPYGSCILRKEPSYPVIFIAGGAGFAPHKALIEQALAEGMERPLYLYWGVRKPNDLYLNEVVQQWTRDFPHFHYIPVLSVAHPGWSGRTGLVHEAVLVDHPDLTHYHVYASGPTEMVYAALHAFKVHNLDRSLMYSDAFDYPMT